MSKLQLLVTAISENRQQDRDAHVDLKWGDTTVRLRGKVHKQTAKGFWLYLGFEVSVTLVEGDIQDLDEITELVLSKCAHTDNYYRKLWRTYVITGDNPRLRKSELY